MSTVCFIVSPKMTLRKRKAEIMFVLNASLCLLSNLIIVLFAMKGESCIIFKCTELCVSLFTAYSDETRVALSAVWVSSLTVNALCHRTVNAVYHSFTCMAWPLLLPNLSR